MGGRIPPQFIDDLLHRVDIVDLIGSRVPLKKAGKDYQARCPFHDEKSPSFTVSRDKQFYHCFGCGAHGTVIGFLMEYDHMSFPEAVEELAQRAGVEVPREEGVTTGPDHAPLFRILEETAVFYATQLRRHPQAERAIHYLKQRGLSGEIAAEYGIGFAPPGWDNLINALGTDPAALERLRIAGMISDPDDRRYDRFRDRIMFPIRDRRGRVIGFGGRVLGDDKPKYLNSPETPLFHKGRELYGLFEAQRALRKLDRLLVVEGYMDVVALAQYGIRNAVATLGTATTAEHLERLFRTTSEVVFCFDGDRAGRDAGWKALNVALPLMRDNRAVRFLFLPEGEDPDTLIRHEGTERFEERIANAAPLSGYLFGHLESQVEMATPDGRARLAELAKPLLSNLPSGVFRDLMEQELNRRVGLHIAVPSGRPTPRPGGRRPASSASQKQSPVRRAITLLLRRPGLAALPGLPQRWRELQRPGIDLLAELLDLLQEQPNLSAAAMIERWRDSEHFRPLCRIAEETLLIPESGMESEFIDALKRLDQQLGEQELQRLLERSRIGQLSDGEKQRLRELLGGRGG